MRAACAAANAAKAADITCPAACLALVLPLLLLLLVPAELLEVLALLLGTLEGSSGTSRPDHQLDHFGRTRSSGSKDVKRFVVAALLHPDAIQGHDRVVFSKPGGICSRTCRHGANKVLSILPPELEPQVFAGFFALANFNNGKFSARRGKTHRLQKMDLIYLGWGEGEEGGRCELL